MRIALLLVVAVAIASSGVARAYTPESPEVRKLIDAGLAHLSTVQEERLGGVCLIALAFLKDDKKDSPWIGKAVATCQKAARENKPEDMYSNGLAIIFLCEYDAKKYSNEIGFFLGALARRQKPHGGWGYDYFDTGDTSQSQYGALALWTAHQHGISVNAGMADKAAGWLMATQDPSGAWGYQGKLAQGGKLVEQEEITCSMVAAAMGSLFICADLFEVIKRGEGLKDQTPILNGSKAVDENEEKRAPPLQSGSLDRPRVLETLKRGDAWMAKNYKVELVSYTSYYMYALERYRSFQEYLNGTRIDEPDWYNNGVEYAMKSQKGPGKWETDCGDGPDTAFTVLFLLRSTRKSLDASLGEGLSIAGIGIPSDLTNLTIRDGAVVANQPKTEIGEMIGMLDDAAMDKLEDLVKDPDALVIDASDEKSIRQLEQMIRTGPWQARMIAVRALARTGNLDHVPTLLYALTDPQPDVVLAARDGLQFLSRRFEGYGPPNDFNRQQQYDALNKWKDWYASIRPDVPVVVE